MTAEQFAYWLQGFVELNAGKMPTPEQWRLIGDHLKTIFHKVTPFISGGTSTFTPIDWGYPVTIC